MVNLGERRSRERKDMNRFTRLLLIVLVSLFFIKLFSVSQDNNETEESTGNLLDITRNEQGRISTNGETTASSSDASWKNEKDSVGVFKYAKHNLKNSDLEADDADLELGEAGNDIGTPQTPPVILVDDNTTTQDGDAVKKKYQ